MQPQDLDNLAQAISKLKEKQDVQRYEGSLLDFSEYVWPVVEPAIPFVKGWVLEAICDHLQAVTEGHIKRLLINVPPGFTKSLMTDVFWPAWEWGPRKMPWLRYVCASYSNHLTERDNMRCRNIVISDRYQKLWKDVFGISNEQFTKVKFANDKTGWKLATSVGGIGVGERGDRFIIDDANNTMEMESAQVRATTNMWFTEVVPDRLNSQKNSAIVVIQQRLHEEDVSGVALSRDMGYTHLCIPMEYEPICRVNAYVNGQIKTLINDDADSVDEDDIFWEDPRHEDGELAWEERFPYEICRALERDKGQYAWCNPYEAPVLMGDLSLKPIGEVKEGDTVIGFVIGDNEKRARLKPSKVLSVSISKQPVVKMTLNSGEVIRCTPNHKWWTGRNDKTHAPYASAKIGSWLSRVCPSKLPNIGGEEIRLAGWLSGFFDGEGSVGLNHRRAGERGSPLITFTQGTGRNGPLCEKLEYVLKTLGFNFGFRDRAPHGKDKDHRLRFYWLKMGETGRASRLPLYQRFLHVVRPTKWRERLIDGAVNGRLYTASEQVVSIESDGEETVYGLETETGNYVVWGLASSNSGQYQQRPAPRGGAILKEEYWKSWDEKEYPPMEFIVAALDSAYTEKQENDPSALTVWGVFRDVIGNPKVMLLYAWEERLPFHELVQKVIDTCTVDHRPTQEGGARFRVDKLIIEAQASGLSVAQEIHRLVTFAAPFGIELFNPRKYGDKVARAHSVQHLFQEGMVYAPDRTFSRRVIDQASIFPKGAHDDLVDSTTMALRYLRDMGFALRTVEASLDRTEELMYRKRLPALYPV